MDSDFNQAKNYVAERLTRELSPMLTYHSIRHTMDDVLPAVTRLSRASNISKEHHLILQTAALFHDTGFLIDNEDHERHSINVARDVLPCFGYSIDQIQEITALIAATKMPQQPSGLLQELICDADLDLLGRDDFLQLNRALFQEIQNLSGPIIEELWLKDQLHFLKNHQFFTPVAKALRDQGKAQNIRRVQTVLASFNGRGSHPAIHP